MREKDRCMEANLGPACGKDPNTSSSDTMRCEGCNNIHLPLDSTPDAAMVESSLLASCHHWKNRTDPSKSNPFLPDESTANLDGCRKKVQSEKGRRERRRSKRGKEGILQALWKRKRRSESAFNTLYGFSPKFSPVSGNGMMACGNLPRGSSMHYNCIR